LLYYDIILNQVWISQQAFYENGIFFVLPASLRALWIKTLSALSSPLYRES